MEEDSGLLCSEAIDSGILLQTFHMNMLMSNVSMDVKKNISEIWRQYVVTKPWCKLSILPSAV
jgi:hypothetical protein